MTETLTEPGPITEELPSQRSLKRRLGLVALAATIIPTVQNIDTFSSAYTYLSNGGSVVPEVAGCEIDQAEKEMHIEAEQGFQNGEGETSKIKDNDYIYALGEISAANKTDIWAIRPNQTLEMVNSWFSSEPFETYQSPRSGIVFEFYTNAKEPDFQLNPRAFDELMLLPFSDSLNYKDPYVHSVMNCAKEQFILEQKFAGLSYPVYIHNTGDSCFSNLRIETPKSYNEVSEKCQSIGFTATSASLKIFMWEVLKTDRSSAIVVPDMGKGMLEERVKRTVAHELAGHGVRRFIADGEKIGIDSEEHFAEFIERKITPLLPEIDLPVIYP